MLDEGRFLVIVSISLLDKINKFEIYDVFNMPVPHDKTPNMVLASDLLVVAPFQSLHLLITYSYLESWSFTTVLM